MTEEIEVFLENDGGGVDAQIESFRGPQGKRGEQGEPGRALRNYALNADFTRFVAQAGICGTHCGGTTKFAGDCWWLASGTFSGDAREDGCGYTNICLNGTICQRLEERPEGAGFAGVQVLGGEAAARYDAQSGLLEITGTQAVLSRVWLCEEETKRPPASRSYPEELALCQRRYMAVQAAGELALHGYAFSSNTARFTLILPVPMRLNSPTALFSYRTNVSIYPGGIMPAAIGYVKAEGTFCMIVMTASGMEANGILICKPNAKIELCCDLM